MLIDQLPTIPTVEDTDELPIEKGTTTYKVTKANLLASTISAISTAINAIKGTATPLEDGTAAVGTSGLLAREDHVHPHDSLIVRKNLLDNWYFVGGGSQLGYGTFPINQRGQTSYSTFGHSIDRWRITTGGTLTVNSDSIRFDGGASTNYTEIRQYFSQALQPGTYTWSMLAKINSVSGTVWMGLRDSSNIVQHNITISSATSGYALFTKTFTLTSKASGWSLSLVTSNATTDTINADIKAFKLELGDTQTLAHQENGAWVLNEVPCYSEELAKCHRYFYRWHSPTNAYGWAFVGVLNSATQGRGILPTPTMAIGQPKSVSISGSWVVETPDDAHTVTGVGYQGVSDNGIVLLANCATFNNYSYFMTAILHPNNDADAYIDISYEL